MESSRAGEEAAHQRKPRMSKQGKRETYGVQTHQTRKHDGLLAQQKLPQRLHFPIPQRGPHGTVGSPIQEYVPAAHRATSHTVCAAHAEWDRKMTGDLSRNNILRSGSASTTQVLLVTHRNRPDLSEPRQAQAACSPTTLWIFARSSVNVRRLRCTSTHCNVLANVGADGLTFLPLHGWELSPSTIETSRVQDNPYACSLPKLRTASPRRSKKELHGTSNVAHPGVKLP